MQRYTKRISESHAASYREYVASEAEKLVRKREDQEEVEKERSGKRRRVIEEEEEEEEEDQVAGDDGMLSLPLRLK